MKTGLYYRLNEIFTEMEEVTTMYQKKQDLPPILLKKVHADIIEGKKIINYLEQENKEVKEIKDKMESFEMRIKKIEEKN